MPTPSNPNDAKRWTHTKLRRNILGGTWEYAVIDTMQEQYSINNVNNMGRPALSVNLLTNTVNQIAVLYDTPSKISNPEMSETQEAIWSQVVDGCHMWQLLQRNNRDVEGLRENFIQVIPTDVGLQLELVSPDQIVVDKTTGDASTPTCLRRSRMFCFKDAKGNDEMVDAWEVWDISDKENPEFRVEKMDGTVVTKTAYPEDTGTYLYVDSDGPYLPFSFYRAQYTSETFDPYTWSELVSGTLDIAVRWTMWGVCVRNNSWGQWVSMDSHIPGASAVVDGQGNTSSPPATVDAAPNSIINMKSDGQPGTGSIKQLEPGKMLEMAQAIELNQRTILNNIGIHPDDIQANSAPESGVAISLKRSAQRKMAMATVPNFRKGDIKLFEIMARTHNIFYAQTAEESLPVHGWHIDYQLPEMSADEFLADLEKDKELVALGLLSAVGLVRKMRGFDTDAEAIQYLKEVQQQNLLYPLTQSVK